MTRVALITGGVSGIGAATARLLKSSGYTVVANYFGNDGDAQGPNSLAIAAMLVWVASKSATFQFRVGIPVS